MSDTTTPERAVPKLQSALMAAFPALTHADFAYHETDLYIAPIPGVRKWLKDNYMFYTAISSFLSPVDSRWNGAGKWCLDIPFAGVWKR